MQIENEPLQFILNQRPPQLKGALSELQIQYLAQLENKATIQELILNGLKSGWLVNFAHLYDLIQKIVQMKLISNKNFYEHFSEIQTTNQNMQKQQTTSQLKSTIDPKKDLKELIKLPFLRSLDSEVAMTLLKESDILDFPAEALICQKGDVFSRYLFILLSGEAAIYGQGAQTKKFISLLKANTVFGEMGFFLGVPRTADIVAVKQSKVLRITGNSEFMDKYLNSDKAQHLVHRFWIQQALLNSEIFKNIPTDSIDELTFGGDIVKIASNQILCSENDVTNGAYIVVQGQFSIQIKNKIVAKISQGQMIGEMSLFQNQGKRTATIIADKDSVLMHIILQKFYQLFAKNLFLAKTLQELSQKRFELNKKTLG